MSKVRLSMRKIEEILRLKYEAGLSHRAIAQSCLVSPSTVSEYVTHAQAVGLSWPLPEGLSAEQLEELLFPTRVSASRGSIPQPDWAEVHKELRRKSVTLSLLWVEYRQAHSDGYGYSQFCHHYRQWAKQLKPMMRQKHRAGEKLFIDYAGQTVPVVDPETGEIREAEIFVAVLGASNYSYAEAHASQSLPNWIGAHVRALAFLGGVPEVLVPDNLKAGVKSPHLYEPDINPTYQEFARYYSVAVVPARVRKPKDKAKAEVGVQVVERWILARLRDWTFFSLAKLNQTIGELLDELNNRLMRHLGQSRQELFASLDQPALAPLPAQPYEFARWKKARVHIDYHVAFEKHYYSVPYALIGKEVDIRATFDTLGRHRDPAGAPRRLAVQHLEPVDDGAFLVDKLQDQACRRWQADLDVVDRNTRLDLKRPALCRSAVRAIGEDSEIRTGRKTVEHKDAVGGRVAGPSKLGLTQVAGAAGQRSDVDPRALDRTLPLVDDSTRDPRTGAHEQSQLRRIACFG